MRMRKPGLIVMVCEILFLTTSSLQASEWSSAKLFGPALKTVGRTAVTFRSSLYVFASTGQQVVYRQSSDGVFWFPQHEWNVIDIETPSSPAATVLNDTIYLFYRTERSEIQYRIFDGSTWSSPFTTNARSTAAPAVVTHNNAIVLAWRNNQGRINYITFNGSSWSGATTIAGRRTNLAPAITSFAGSLYIVVTDTDSRFSLTKPPDPGWTNISCMDCSVRATSPVTMVVSNGKLLLFTTDGIPKRIVMRVLDRTFGTDLFLPEDDWMKTGTFGASVAAGALERKVALFSDGTSGLPGVIPFFVATYGFSYHVAEWTTIPLAVVQTADDNCSNKADLTNVPRWVQYANLVYAPLLIDYIRSLDRTICDKGLQGDSFDNTVASTYASASEFHGSVVVYFRARASGGAFSGASLNFVAMPETLSICDARGVSSRSFFNNDLAHEVGHYFGLPHTFKDFEGHVPMSKAQIQQMLEDSGFDITKAFDRDLEEAGVGDTPPDPLYESGNVSADKCTSKNNPVTLSGVGGTPITLVPPRTNVMSYYQISATVVNSLTPGQRSVVYQFVRSKLGL